jgi:signal transduction histidine kinase
MLSQSDSSFAALMPEASPPGRENRRSRIFKASAQSGLVPEKASLSRTQQLLELAGRVVGAAWGGVGVLSPQGQLVEHRTFGVAEPVAEALARSPALPELIRSVWQRREGVKRSLPDLESPLGGVADLPPIRSFLCISLDCIGSHQGALYLIRSLEQPPFGAAEEEALRAIQVWINQENLLEESSLLAQIRLLNHVAQAAAGKLDLGRIVDLTLRELERYLPLNVSAVWLQDTEVTGPKLETDGGVERGERTVEAIRSPLTIHHSPLATHHSPTHHIVLAGVSSADRAGADFGLAPGMRLDLEQTAFAATVRDSQPVYVDLVSLGECHSPMTQTLAAAGGTVSFAVPLRAGEQIMGVLQSISSNPGGFTREQIQLLYLVADLLGPAVSNCRLYERLRAAYEELRRTQSQLIQAEKMRALGELAGGMAHDFNNALCGALGFLELALVNSALPADCRGYLESSRTLALDAAQTVRRVQDFARWGRNEGETELVDVNDLVRQTIHLTRPKWESLGPTRRAAISVDVQTEARGWVTGSASELREVITNLVFNAVDAMPQGGSLVIRTWSSTSDLFLSVRDTGLGMTESVRKRLFEPFFTTKGDNGTGLGLSVSFGIVQRFGGEITATSVPGQGSTFTVRLPLDPKVNRNPKLSSHSPAAATARSLRILVVEDQETIARFLTTSLTQMGHRPRWACTGPGGLAAFGEEPFDVVLTDFGLPEMNGAELARAVSERSPQTPIVLLTGWADQIQASNEEIAGVTRILGKPVQIATLAATLLEVCQP